MTLAIAADPCRASLAYRPPYDWPALLAFLAARATPGVEAVAGATYRRTVRLDGCAGVVAVAPARGHALAVEASPALRPAFPTLVARLRRLLDLDADPAPIGAHLAADPALAPLVRRRPGLRVPGAVDGFELAVRAILGQQVSVRGATTLAGRLAALLGDPLAESPRDAECDDADCSDAECSDTPRTLGTLGTLAPTPERIADAGVDRVASIGLPRARAATIVALARAVADGTLRALDDPAASASDPDDTVRRLVAVPGIGAWTASYVAMRALRSPDAFPHGDLALRRAMSDLSPTALRRAAEPWRPWRAYAAMHLWASLGDALGDARAPSDA